MIAGGCSNAIRVGHKQCVGGESQPAGPSENRVAGVGILGRKGGLPDHQPRGLSRGKVGGAYGGRGEQEYGDALHAQCWT